MEFWGAYLFIAVCMIICMAIGARTPNWEKERKLIPLLSVAMGLFLVIGIFVTWKAFES